MIEVKVDTSALRELTTRKAISVLRQATVKSLNRALGSTRTEASRIAQAELSMKRTEALKNLLFTIAKQPSLEAKIRIGGRGISLMAFSPKKVRVQTKRGRRIGVSILVKGVRQIVPGGFLATMPNGKRGVFARKGQAQYPIKQLFSKVSPLADLLATRTPKLQQVAEAAFRKNFDHDFSFYAQKAGIDTNGRG
jgi:hypothetical protein